MSDDTTLDESVQHDGADGVDAGLHGQLRSARHDLLDLTARNRLLNTPRRRKRSSSIEILDELSEEVYRILVTEGRDMTFLARPEEPEDEREEAPGLEDEPEDVVFDLHLVQPESDGGGDDEEAAAAPLAERHTDLKLQTGMTSPILQQRLLRLYYDTRTVQEEQGVNVLFLALGFLKWYEDDTSDVARHAPLILVPVELDRRSAASRFRLRWTGEDIATNLSLQFRLSEFGIDLPELPAAEDLSPTAYAEAVRTAVAGMERFEVLADDMVLWGFSFAKLMMFRDLDPENWPEDGGLESRPLVRQLLTEGFTPEPPLWDETRSLDEQLDALATVHILDADSSQSEVIEEVRRGRNLVVQGPPGTGKSQTIANIIAAAVCEGKRVLFLAEKMAALDVVKRRLINAGLGDRVKDQCDLCLELHSTRATKRKVLEELDRTLRLDKPVVDDVAGQAADLDQARDTLNAHAAMMHRPDEPSELTPFRVVGELVRLRREGATPPDFTLPDAEQWRPDQLRLRTQLLEELTIVIDGLGRPADHPWRGVGLDALLPMDRDRLAESMPSVTAAVRDAIAAADGLATLMQRSTSLSARDARGLASFARRLAAMPPLDADALTHDDWADRTAEIEKLVEAGRTVERARLTLGAVVSEAAWTLDVSLARRDLAAYGGSIFRVLRGPYRRAMATIRGILTDKPPKRLRARLEVLDTLIAGQNAREAVQTGGELGARVFGRRWSGEMSDWDLLSSVLEWDRGCRDDTDIPDDYRQTPKLLNDDQRRDAGTRGTAVERRLDAMLKAVGALFDRVLLDVPMAFDEAGDEPATAAAVPMATILQRIELWQERLESIAAWITYRQRNESGRAAGLADLCDRLYDGRIEPDAAERQFLMAFHEAIVRRMMASHRELAEFQGLSHERVLAEFRDLDEQRIRLARQQVALAHYDTVPRGGGEIGELGLIRREINKKTRHLPIRKLLVRAGNAVTRIKPVFMMSPMSVAQYLAPGALDFDLLLIDEASQVRPVDALGAAARARQIVVVGDDRQLPPTRFFARSLGDIELDDDDDEPRAADLESILGLAHAQSASGRMLRWHYRSRHHSLIAVSNREFYDGRLFVIPSPRPRGELGVVFRHLPDARYDRGGSRVNRMEARVVAEAVMNHAQRFPDLSLGVGTFSVQQRDAILDELERLRREYPALESFFIPDTAEPFFVKNLENIQGDERDVIFVSVGYGPDDETGRVSMNFGPLSADGGERRLNVLITRARQRCELFSSIRHEHIDLGRATGRGPQAFKAYLHFAETGELDGTTLSRRDHDSPFERSVAEAIEAQGFEVEAQVGVAGFFIDLAVRDPDMPGRFLLGIECDGASYHSSRWARDRDRLRQQVLERLGWTIHRIWSVDWFHRPREQIEKVLEAIEAARSTPTPPEPAPVVDETPIDRTEDDEPGDTFAVPYTEATVKVPRDTEIHELPTTKMAGIVEKIVDVETPIHGDEVAQRVTALWGFQRTGSRIRRSVAAALDHACSGGRIRCDDGFYATIDEREIDVRNRYKVTSSTLRRPEMLPPLEVRRCVRLLVAEHVGVSRDEAIVATARLLGFRLTSGQLRAVIGAQIDALIATGDLVEASGRLQLSNGTEK